MATWSVKPNWKKSIIERQEMIKDDNTLIVETGWRWGEFHVETDDDSPPKLKPGVDMFNCEYESEMIETTDGCWEEHDMDDCDEETREWLEEFFEENSYFDLEEHGWIFSDCEMIIDCDMTIERLDEDGKPTGEIYNTEDITDDEESTEVDESVEPKSTKLVPGAAWPFENATVSVPNAMFKCTNCDFETEDIMDLVDNPNDDDKGAYLCPKCNSKVDLE